MAKIGEIMMDEGLVCPEDVDQALAIQNREARGERRLFGKVLCDMNLVTPMDNYYVLAKYNKLVSLSSFLVGKKIASPSRLEEVEAHALQEDIPYISGLLEAGIVSKAQMQQALFELFHIPLRSVSDIVFSQESRELLAQVLDRGRAARHKVVPLSLSGNTLLMGITDPSNLVLLRDLDQDFPLYRFTPVFITFSGFTWFYKLVYQAAWGAAPVPALRGAGNLCDFSVTLTDPAGDEAEIKALYDRYEECRRGRRDSDGQNIDHQDAGHQDIDRPDMERQILFFEFIRRNYRMMAEKFQCRAVEFSLKQEGGRILVTALPGSKGE